MTQDYTGVWESVSGLFTGPRPELVVHPPSWRMYGHANPCGLATLSRRRPRIELFPRVWWTQAQYKATLAHELAHLACMRVEHDEQFNRVLLDIVNRAWGVRVEVDPTKPTPVVDGEVSLALFWSGMGA